MKRTFNQSMIEILTRIIDMIQSDGCEGCTYEMYAEWQNPCSICKRSKKDFYRREVMTDERNTT